MSKLNEFVMTNLCQMDHKKLWDDPSPETLPKFWMSALVALIRKEAKECMSSPEFSGLSYGSVLEEVFYNIIEDFELE